jgi:hypothetical protein
MQEARLTPSGAARESEMTEANGAAEGERTENAVVLS